MFVIAYLQFQLGERTIDEVVIFLRKIDWDELNELFNIGAEAIAWVFADSDYYCFRRDLRIRIHKAREFAWRMYNNARVIQQWASTELSGLSVELVERREEQHRKIQHALDLAIEARSLMMIRLVKLTVWTLLRADRWPVQFVPRIAVLRKSESEDLIELYDALRRASADLARRYGQKFHDEVIAAF